MKLSFIGAAHEVTGSCHFLEANGKNILIHRLVAFAFCENKHGENAVQIHHKDGNRQNNYFKNLEILTAEEHKKRHLKKDKADNENPLS